MVEEVKGCIWWDELTPQEQEFFDLVEKSNMPAIEKLLAKNVININAKNIDGISPLNLAIQNDCKPLVELLLRQKNILIRDAVLFAVEQNRIDLLNRLIEYENENARIRDLGTDTDQFRSHITPLMLAAQCGQRDTIMYLLERGYKLDRPHPPRCVCLERCGNPDRLADPVAVGHERLDAYRAISNPIYLCCTDAFDPLLAAFRLHRELLECGSIHQFYETEYAAMAQQMKNFVLDLVNHCRTSNEVKVLLQNRNGCLLRGRFPYPRLITAMDYNQKEFVANTNVQQVLESLWMGDLSERESYSTFWKFLYPIWLLVNLVRSVWFGVIAPRSPSNRKNRLPINRMYNSLVVYLIFLVLLFIHSNEDKSEVNRGMPESIPWVLIGVFVCGHVVEKFKLRSLQGPKRFFGNMWNAFDTVELMLFIIAYLCWFWAWLQVIMSSEDFGNEERARWHWFDPQLVAEGIFAVATVMAYIRLLFLLQLNYYIAPIQVSLGKLVLTLLKFIPFFVMILVSYTCGMGTYYEYYRGMVLTVAGKETKQEDSFVSIKDTLKTFFWGMFGMTAFEAPIVVIGNSGDNKTDGGDDSEANVHQHYFTQVVGYSMFATYEILMVIVLMNILIAYVSNVFQRVVDSSYEWIYGRTKVYVSFVLLDDLPPPLNLCRSVIDIFPCVGRDRGQKPDSRLHKSFDYSRDDKLYQVELLELTEKLIRQYLMEKAPS